jgi:hypothetical protein
MPPLSAFLWHFSLVPTLPEASNPVKENVRSVEALVRRSITSQGELSVAVPWLAGSGVREGLQVGSEMAAEEINSSDYLRCYGHCYRGRKA